MSARVSVRGTVDRIGLHALVEQPGPLVQPDPHLLRDFISGVLDIGMPGPDVVGSGLVGQRGSWQGHGGQA